MTDLTPTERTMLRIASMSWRYSGARDQVIRDELGMSSVQFFQRLNHMLDDPRVEAGSPVVVHRLQRLRSQRQRSRSTRRAA